MERRRGREGRRGMERGGEERREKERNGEGRRGGQREEVHGPFIKVATPYFSVI